MERISNLEREYVSKVLDNEFRSSLNSIYNTKLEAEFSKQFESEYSIAIINGTATLHTALKSLGIGPGDEVIVPPLTMSSPAISVLQAGAIPVFADVEKDTYTICPESIEKNITKKTKAIMTVALYGLAPDYDKILKICSKYNLRLIEDNAQCFLGKYKGKLVGTFGDFSSYSFQASKHMTSGEGGMLTTNQTDLADSARKFTSLGYAGVSSSERKISKSDIQDPGYNRHVSLGFNYRMSELTAAVALAQLERLQSLVDNRIACAKLFDEVIQETDLFVAQKVPEGYVNSYWAYCVTLNENRPLEDWYKFKELFKELGGDGYYSAWKLSYQEPFFKSLSLSSNEIWQKYDSDLCPTAEAVQPRMLQFKTDFWDLEEAARQAAILKDAISKF